MSIFKIKNTKFTKIKEKSFDYEKDLQKLVEQNLQDVFGLEFVSGSLNKEFHVTGTHQELYLDTLAFDSQTNSFVIIEYKRDKSFSIIDQGYTYLSAMLNNKAEFILEYAERKNIQLKREEIDWSQAKVIFIAKEFTPYQKGAIGFRDLPVELWEVQLLDDNLIAFNQIKPLDTQESIVKVSKNRTIAEVSKEVKTYTLEDHYKKASKDMQELLNKIREMIFAIDENIKEKPTQIYLGYKLNWYNFVSIHVFKDKLRIYVRKEKFASDTGKRFTKVPESYNWGKTPLWWIDVSKESEINYLIKIMKESYDNAPDR